MRSPLLAAAALTLAVGTLAGPALTSPTLTGAATAAGGPVVTFPDDPRLPFEVPLDSDPTDGATGPADHPAAIGVDIEYADPNDDVQFHVASPDRGIEVVDPDFTAADTTRTDTDQGDYFVVQAEARTPGLHELVYTASAPGYTTVTWTQDYVWAAGGAPISGGDSLAGRVLRSSGTNGSEFITYTREITFVDGKHARYGVPQQLSSGCAKPGSCVPYEYDASTGLVQVGASVIGLVAAPDTVLVNATPPDPVDDDYYNRASFRTYRSDPGVRLDHTWSLDDVYTHVSTTLRLRGNGHYVLGVGFHHGGQHYVRHYSGTYHLGPGAELTLRDHHGHVVLRPTFLVAATYYGRRVPAKGALLRLTESVTAHHHTSKVAIDEGLLPPGTVLH